MHTIKLIGLKTHNMTSLARQLGRFLGFERNPVLFLGAVILIGAGEETWIRFVPKYPEVLARHSRCNC